MTLSLLVDVAFKVFNNREQQEKPEDTGQNLTFLAAALDYQVGRNLKRGKPLLGREQQTYCKGERHWKTGCPGIRNEKENNDRKTGASHMVEREEHSNE